jgi:hypothetical protein
MKKLELKQIIKEEIRLKKLNSTSPQLNKLIQDLIDKGYKEYQLDIKNNYGVYFITLPYSSLNTHMLANLIRILPEGSSIGVFPNLHSGLSIRTSISI